MISKKKKYILISLALIISVTVGYASTMLYGYSISPAVKEDVVICIPTGSTFDQQIEILRKSNAIKNINKYARYAKFKGFDKKTMPGRYQLKKGVSYGTLVNTLGRGMQTPVNLTFNSIRTRDRLAGVVSKYIEADSVSLLNALNSDTLAARYGFDNQNFIGMFIPNTYQFYWNTSATQFVDRMHKEYLKFWNKDRTAMQEASGLSKAQIITLASIVAEETNKGDEMPRIAGVYLNRLKVGMLLQADPTVKFAIGDFSIKRILYTHLTVDSPYNTYKYPGIPPGPICIPSIKAIDAVLNPERHGYIYFCAKEDFSGYHNFATNYADHTKNAQAYSNALNKLHQ